jgi:hypothetical protein
MVKTKSTTMSASDEIVLTERRQSLAKEILAYEEWLAALLQLEEHTNTGATFEDALDDDLLKDKD